MFGLKTALSGLISAILISNLTYADENRHAHISGHNGTHTRHTTALELKPIPLSGYKTAGVTFLPDLEDSENGWAGFDLDNNYNKNSCTAYPFNSCPAGGICEKCAVGSKYKLKGCHQGYIFGGTKCTPLSCSAINPTYKNQVPINQICTRITKGTLTCFKDCRPVSCDGYSLFCGTASSIPHFESIDFCPECLANNPNSNCEPKFCRIKSCTAGYKVSADGKKCVEQDDTCPNGYYKSCETGTQGTPQYTEKGTACYQCKPVQAEPVQPERECTECDKNEVCVYTDLTGRNFCIGSQCSEEEYPDISQSEPCIKKSCVIAPTYGQWCSQKSCSEENPLCKYTFDYNNHPSPSCKVTPVVNHSSSDDINASASCKIAGDYSAYECPPGQKCLYAIDEADNSSYYYLSGRCVDASISDKDIQDAIIKTIHADAACTNLIVSMEEARFIVFYQENQKTTELLNELEKLKTQTQTQSYIANKDYWDWNEKIKCKNNTFNQCVNPSAGNNGMNVKTCPFDTSRFSSNGVPIDMSCQIKDSDYNITFCKMDYCAVNLNKIDQYKLNSRTKEIITTYVLHEINQKLIDNPSATPAVIYALHSDNKTVSFRDYATGTYINNLLHGCGACSKYIGTHEKITISSPLSGTPCYPKSWLTSCTSDTSTGYAYRMIYNPDRLKESRGEKDCYEKIIAGEDWCRLSSEKVYEHKLSDSGYIEVEVIQPK